MSKTKILALTVYLSVIAFCIVESQYWYAIAWALPGVIYLLVREYRIRQYNEKIEKEHAEYRKAHPYEAPKPKVALPPVEVTQMPSIEAFFDLANSYDLDPSERLYVSPLDHGRPKAAMLVIPGPRVRQRQREMAAKETQIDWNAMWNTPAAGWDMVKDESTASHGLGDRYWTKYPLIPPILTLQTGVEGLVASLPKHNAYGPRLGHVKQYFPQRDEDSMNAAWMNRKHQGLPLRAEVDTYYDGENGLGVPNGTLWSLLDYGYLLQARCNTANEDNAGGGSVSMLVVCNYRNEYDQTPKSLSVRLEYVGSYEIITSHEVPIRI